MGTIAVFMTVRNRLSLSEKCIEALYKNTSSDIHLFVFDNCTTHNIDGHFTYFSYLYKQGKLQKYVVNTLISTFNAFSKAMSFNEFGVYIESLPDKSIYDFLLCLDNDMILVEKDWDLIIKEAMEATSKKIPTLEIWAQYPGGCSGHDYTIPIKGQDTTIRLGINSGSGFWCIKPDFFSRVGLIEPELLVGINKRHDIELWSKLNELHKGKPYVCAIKIPMALHFSYFNGKDLSICKPTRNDPSKEIIHHDVEKLVNSMSYEEFIEFIKKDEELFSQW